MPKDKEVKDYATTIGMIEAAFVTGMFLLIGLVIKQFI